MVNAMLCILGRSGAGKDTLAMRIEEKYGLDRVISYTTRPKRQGETGTHIFVTKEEANRLTDRAAETKIGEYEYFTTEDQIDTCDIYVIDPIGLDQLTKRFPDRNFLAVYVSSDPMEARKHAIIRGKSEKEGAIFDRRRLAEDEEFSRFESKAKSCDGRYCDNCEVMWINNDYTKECMDNAVEQVVNRYLEIGAELIRSSWEPFR
ncbi:hypothetical protein ACKX2D_05350 [Lachnospiraceae bacterium YH-ros2226]